MKWYLDLTLPRAHLSSRLNYLENSPEFKSCQKALCAAFGII